MKFKQFLIQGFTAHLSLEFFFDIYLTLLSALNASRTDTLIVLFSFKVMTRLTYCA